MLDGRELRVQMARYGRPTSPQRRFRGRRRYRSVEFYLTATFINCFVGLVHVLDILVLTLGPEVEGVGPGLAVGGHAVGAIPVQTAKAPEEGLDQHRGTRSIQNPSLKANPDPGLGHR